MCEDYRASASVDMDEAKEHLKEGRLIRCPLRVLWGKHGVIEKCFDAVNEWQIVAAPDIEVDGWNVDSGHYIPRGGSSCGCSECEKLFKINLSVVYTAEWPGRRYSRRISDEETPEGSHCLP